MNCLLAKHLAWFDEIEEDALAQAAGGKGASLCRLSRGKLMVPEGFIVCSGMFDSFVDGCGFREEIHRAAESVDVEDMAALEAESRRIRDMITGAPMPLEMEKGIRDFYSRLGENEPVAVRSSGTAEDLDDASFAGQQDTFLYVTGADDVVRYVQECWASLYNDRAIFYRRVKGFGERRLSIAVVVQRMVAAIKAGVMFTAHPITRELDKCLIEGTWGLGEAIVSGMVTPDSYTVDKTGKLLESYISEKEIMVARRIGQSGTEEREVPEERRCVQVLTEDELAQLAALAVRLEAYFGKPQDVEWAIEAGRLYLLQSRPITTI